MILKMRGKNYTSTNKKQMFSKTKKINLILLIAQGYPPLRKRVKNGEKAQTKTFEPKAMRRLG